MCSELHWQRRHGVWEGCDHRRWSSGRAFWMGEELDWRVAWDVTRGEKTPANVVCSTATPPSLRHQWALVPRPDFHPSFFLS